MKTPPKAKHLCREELSTPARMWRAMRGFSLIEVTMALGIVSFALVPLVALLPVGLSSFRDSRGDSREAQFVQTIANSLQQAPFASLTQMGSTPERFTFDVDGKLTTLDSEIHYVATVTATPTMLPGVADLASANILTCEVEITSRYGPPSISRRSFLVANSGN